MLVMGQSGNPCGKERNDGAHPQPEYVRTDWHWTFGWLRRPECDETFGYCYEDPSGDMYYFQSDAAKDCLLLDVMIDRETGDEFLCMSHRPPIRRGRPARISK